MAVEVRRTTEGLELALSGEWGAREFGAVDAQLDGLSLGGARRVLIDAAALTRLDLSGAWALHEFIARARAAGAEVSFKGQAPDQLRLLDETLKEAQKGVETSPPAPPPQAAHGALMRGLIDVGRHTERSAYGLEEGLARSTCARSPSPATSTRPASPRSRSWR
jgi:ABC-type transporter Mla MlaB component